MKTKNNKVITWAVCIYAVVLVLINFTRVFYNNFWGDECHSILMSRMPLKEMLPKLVGETMTPLYFLLLKALTAIFGEIPFAYHMASFIPYVVMVAFICTLFRKICGNEAAFILLTLFSLSENPYIYINEVRMYELAACGVVVAYMVFYEILADESLKNYLIFAIASLVGVYSHYIAVIPVAALYISLLIYSVTRKRKIRNIIYLYVGTVAGFIPWLAQSVSVALRISQNGFWIKEIPDLKWSLLYYFGTNKYYSALMLLIVLLSVAAVVFKKFKGRNKFTDHDYWFVTGIVSGFSSLIALRIISLLITPSLLLRYLYPAVLVLMTAISAQIPRFIKKEKLLWAVVGVITIVCAVKFVDLYTTERSNDIKCREAYTALAENVEPGDIVVSNVSHYECTIMDYYFPDLNVITISSQDHRPYEIAYEPEDGVKYWMVWRFPLDDVDKKWLADKNLTAKPVIEDGYFADWDFYMYEIER